MLPMLSPAVMVLLTFFIEGARSQLPDQEFTPTANPAPLPSSTQVLFLQNFNFPLTTCTVHNVSWSYNGPDTRLDIAATNVNVPQGPPPAPFPSRPVVTFTDEGVVRALRPRAITTDFIAQDLEASALHIPWKVSVPSGWYSIVVANGNGRLDQTDPFFVQDGPDTSCLLGFPTTSSTSSLSPSSSNPASGAPQETVSPPAPIASTSKDNHVGIIIGVVAGVVVALIVILIAFLCLRRRKHTQERPASVLPGAGLRRGWGGLGSFSSIHSVKPAPTSRDLAVTTREHTRHTEERAPRSSVSTPFSLEEKVSTSPVFSSRNPFDDTEGGITLATLPSNGRRSSSARSSLQQYPPRHNPSISAIVNSYDLETSTRSTDLSSSRHNSLSTAEMMPSYSSSSSSSASPTERNKAEHGSSGSQSGVRKTPRKPVPAYDPAVHTSSTPSPLVENTSPIALTPGTPIVSSISGQGHYAKKSQYAASNPEGIDRLPRKSSFGPGGIEGKPIHYLIPDMPLPKAN
ncbi:hypothetical protein AGABI1DRAFT_108806 [Agaricus bisporus var. burnettii JB137-S8]|uniref:Mid2 domain-containing protein n=1 Tax=Agaricus bisporus var. burnettii (strain JB137-S8 / ATCC MYA-4627 / FGSC 10392) TaxID=597362 RepID=K5WME6_AGABU|nr:uncharacterized protein AGABI1DRAFT_108806 [Agaricus bisporus var. burnettii JB137-S8]EKM76496.1 hypothetical protein AGABI1DRAFT_108806 [Agaricus bisporus var. burnettii JB137-S8]